MSKYLAYVAEGDSLETRGARLHEGYYGVLWRPRLFHLVPKGLKLRPLFLMWWVLYYLRLGRSVYGILLVYKNRSLAHYSVVTSKDFRFPLLSRDDIQIGPVWTDEQHRRKGLASYAISEILGLFARPRRKFWYIVRQENYPSRQLVERLNFANHGEVIRNRRFITRWLLPSER